VGKTPTRRRLRKKSNRPMTTNIDVDVTEKSLLPKKCKKKNELQRKGAAMTAPIRQENIAGIRIEAIRTNASRLRSLRGKKIGDTASGRARG